MLIQIVANDAQFGSNVNAQEFLVAATFEKANTYVFAEMTIHNPKVGGSIPPRATK
jgi:hypothetical protein